MNDVNFRKGRRELGRKLSKTFHMEKSHQGGVAKAHAISHQEKKEKSAKAHNFITIQNAVLE